MVQQQGVEIEWTEERIAAGKAACVMEDEFYDHTRVLNEGREMSTPLFDSNELRLGEKLIKQSEGGEFVFFKLKGITLKDADHDPPLDDEQMEHRERFMFRANEEDHFSVKFVGVLTTPKADTDTATRIGAYVMNEAKILMNLAPHPNICQLYGVNAIGTSSFGATRLEDGFFLVLDRITETLPERFQAWRDKKSYSDARFDDLQRRQSQITQRVEVAHEICSAMSFLSNFELLFNLHPEKIGFDSRYGRVKLFNFGDARDYKRSSILGAKPTTDVRYLAYRAKEHFDPNPIVTHSADVYAFGMLIWEILTLQPPFDGTTAEWHLKHVIHGNTRPALNKTWPKDIRKIMEKCWADKEKRPTMKQVAEDLENLLLFQSFDGIDSTEIHISQKPRNEPIASGSGRSTTSKGRTMRDRLQRNIPDRPDILNGHQRPPRDQNDTSKNGKISRIQEEEEDPETPEGHRTTRRRSISEATTGSKESIKSERESRRAQRTVDKKHKSVKDQNGKIRRASPSVGDDADSVQHSRDEIGTVGSSDSRSRASRSRHLRERAGRSASEKDGDDDGSPHAARRNKANVRARSYRNLKTDDDSSARPSVKDKDGKIRRIKHVAGDDHSDAHSARRSVGTSASGDSRRSGDTHGTGRSDRIRRQKSVRQVKQSRSHDSDEDENDNNDNPRKPESMSSVKDKDGKIRRKKIPASHDGVDDSTTPENCSWTVDSDHPNDVAERKKKSKTLRPNLGRRSMSAVALSDHGPKTASRRGRDAPTSRGMSRNKSSDVAAERKAARANATTSTNEKSIGQRITRALSSSRLMSPDKSPKSTKSAFASALESFKDRGARKTKSRHDASETAHDDDDDEDVELKPISFRSKSKHSDHHKSPRRRNSEDEILEATHRDDDEDITPPAIRRYKSDNLTSTSKKAHRSRKKNGVSSVHEDDDETVDDDDTSKRGTKVKRKKDGTEKSSKKSGERKPKRPELKNTPSSRLVSAT